MPKIYLSPAYHRWNPCAVAGCDETSHNNRYLDELEPYLKACGIAYRRGPRRAPKSSEDGTALMKKAVAESNAWKPDIHYISHTNAANGRVRGYRPIIFPGSTNGQKIAECLMKRRREIYDQAVTLNTRSDLYELKATAAPAYYEEHVFHDNRQDAQWFHDNLRNIARQTCKGFCDYFGIPFADPYKGDVDGDGKVTTADALQALQGAVGKTALAAGKEAAADMNGDGRITTADALEVLQKAVGKR